MTSEQIAEQFKIIKDYNGREIKLFDYTVKHIKISHPELENIALFVENILKHPVLVTEDELPNTVVYHHSVKKPLVHVAYVEVVENKVKSAHISDKIKGGTVLWLGAKNLNI